MYCFCGGCLYWGNESGVLGVTEMPRDDWWRLFLHTWRVSLASHVLSEGSFVFFGRMIRCRFPNSWYRGLSYLPHHSSAKFSLPLFWSLFFCFFGCPGGEGKKGGVIFHVRFKVSINLIFLRGSTIITNRLRLELGTATLKRLGILRYM